MNTFEKLVIVGVGLIGGSIALAARNRGLARKVVGVGRRRESLDQACELGIIEAGFLEIPEAVTDADLVVFCAPVHLIADHILLAAPRCPDGVLLTDAGSTKSVIVQAIEGKLPEGITFIGSHPLAGSEKKGPEFAEEHLFQDRLTVVTPTANCDDSRVSQLCAFWQAMGSRVKRMSPEDHDRALALTSHLPHLLASALSGLLPEDLMELTATGFRDTTRIAAGDSSIWTGIFRQNREAVLDALTQLELRLTEFRQAIAQEDGTALDTLLIEGKRVRDALGS